MGNLYSDLKMFHFQERLDSLPKELPLQPPIYVRIKPTNRCNHRCRYCAYREPDLQLGQDMQEADSIPRGKMLEIAHDLVDLGVKAVAYSGGGEPFVYPHLLEASRILHDGGVQLAALTNGATLSGEKADFFAHNATWLRVSMDGWDDESYRQYRGLKSDEYTKIMQNLENFSKIGGSCVLGISYIVDAMNWQHIPEMLRRYKDIGIASVKVSACIVSNNAKENNNYHKPHFVKVENIIKKSTAELADENFEIVNAWHTLSDRFPKKYTWCPFSQLHFVIGADQKVYPCHDKAYNDNAILGDLRHQSFAHFIETGKQSFFKINPSRNCQHHCSANDKNKFLLDYLKHEHKVFV